jgi:predicted metalloprotease with PDZ domain
MAEGITSYYDDLGLVRCGKISTENYLELLGTAISRVARGRGEQKQTVTESSFDAWTRFYKQDENASNAIVSYYAKGSLVALALDFTLRRVTDGQKTLDDLMRLLWQRYGKIGVGVPEQGIQLLAEELAGQSLQEFFDLALYSTEPLPLAELLADAGVELHWRAPISHADHGGKPGNGTVPLNLGVRVAEDALGARIQVAFEQGAAMAAGLSAGDVIIALNGMKTDARKLDDQLQQFLPGDEIEVHAFRRDELLRVKVRLDVGEASLAYLTVAAGGLTEVGKSWLGK